MTGLAKIQMRGIQKTHKFQSQVNDKVFLVMINGGSFKLIWWAGGQSTCTVWVGPVVTSKERLTNLVVQGSGGPHLTEMARHPSRRWGECLHWTRWLAPAPRLLWKQDKGAWFKKAPWDHNKADPGTVGHPHRSYMLYSTCLYSHIQTYAGLS